MTLDETRFHRLADAALAAIEDSLGESADVEATEGVLTLDLDDGRRYVVNKHAPNREIWLASPLSGAWHFAWDETSGRWLSTRGEDVALDDLLAREFAG